MEATNISTVVFSQMRGRSVPVVDSQHVFPRCVRVSASGRKRRQSCRAVSEGSRRRIAAGLAGRSFWRRSPALANSGQAS